MFDFIRNHQRLMQLLLLLLIFPSFALFGIESYMSSSGREGDLANVAGMKVTRAEFDQAQRERIDEFRRAYGDKIDSNMLNTPEQRQALLDDLLARKVLDVEIQKKKLTVSDATIQESILAIPGLQKPDGSFDKQRYQQILAAQNLNEAYFIQSQRKQMALEQLLRGVQGGAFVPKTVAERLFALQEQERVVQAMPFKGSSYQSKVNLSDEQIKAYYDKNAKQFEVAEQVSIEYVVLNQEAVAASIAVSDKDIADYYAQNKQRFTSEEQRRASHILFTVDKNASAADKEKIKAKALSVLAEVKKNPQDFAKLAKQYSQDPGSAERGGDLDFFGKGAMVKPFEDAVNKLQQGQISDLVSSDFGFHIIQLTAIKPAETKPLEQLKAQITGEVQKQKAAKAYSESVEAFNNLIESADNLKTVADKLKLTIQTAQAISAEAKPGIPATVVTNNPKFLKALFSENVLKKKLLTEAIDIAPNTLAAGRVVEHKPAYKKPLDEVKAQIRQNLLQEEGIKLAISDAQAKLKSLQQADSAAGFEEAKVVSRLNSAGLPAPAITAIMKLDAQKLPAFVAVTLPDEGQVVYRVTEVRAGKSDVARRNEDMQQVNNLQAQQQFTAYLAYLKQQGKLKINKAALNGSDSSAQ